MNNFIHIILIGIKMKSAIIVLFMIAPIFDIK